MNDDLDSDIIVGKFRKHAELVGQAAITWNCAHSIIFVIFYELAKMPYEHAQAIYFALKADTQQRDITSALANAALSGTARKRVVSAIRKFGELSSERNAIIHSIWDVPSDDAPIRANADMKIFYPGYDEEDVGIRMAAFEDRVRKAQEQLFKAHKSILRARARQ